MSTRGTLCNAAMLTGRFAEREGITYVGTLRREYGEGFAEGYRSDMRLDTLLQREHASSLSQLLRRGR